MTRCLPNDKTQPSQGGRWGNDTGIFRTSIEVRPGPGCPIPRSRRARPKRALSPKSGIGMWCALHACEPRRAAEAPPLPPPPVQVQEAVEASKEAEAVAAAKEHHAAKVAATVRCMGLGVHGERRQGGGRSERAGRPTMHVGGGEGCRAWGQMALTGPPPRSISAGRSVGLMPPKFSNCIA